MRFVTRHSYRRGLDGARVSQLHADWQQSFEAVTQWQEKGFEKPKFHQGEHLELALDQFGPFRAFWCMPWEGFLQLLKHMFEISNWKTAPYTVCKHWATKSVMHYRDPARASWYARHARHTPRTPRRTRHTRRKPHTPRPARAATRATPMMHPAGVSLRDSPSQRKVRPSWAPSTGEGASDTHGPPRAPGRQINSSLPVRIAEAPPIPSPTHATHAARHKRRSGSTSTVRHHAACPAVHARAECTASARQVHKRCRAQR